MVVTLCLFKTFLKKRKKNSIFFKVEERRNIGDIMKVVRIFPTIFNAKDNEEINVLITLNKLKVTLSIFKKYKSIGLDGWTMEFYKYFFDLVGLEVK